MTYDHCTLGTEVHYTVGNILRFSAAVENYYLIKSVEKGGLRKVNFANVCTGLKGLMHILNSCPHPSATTLGSLLPHS